MSVGLIFALVGLIALALGLLILPLLPRQRGPASRDAYNLAVYRDQLAEIERDRARGLLSAEQAEPARAEIGRRILGLGPAETETVTGAKPLVAAIAAILLLPVAALLIYARLGSPSLPGQPFAARGSPAATPADAKTGAVDMAEALARLRAHLLQRPDDLTGWLLLARSELGLARYDEAATAYARAAELSGNRAEIVGDWGEALVLAAGGTVTDAARQAFEAGVSDPQTGPRSRYYLALARMQQGDAAGALTGWVDLEAESPAGAEWLPMLRRRIAETAAAQGIDPATLKTGGMPSEAAVAAAASATAGASAEERRAMIDAMVERLAARLEQQPDDVEGWARLGRSYMVLHQPVKAREAYARAVRLKPDDASLQQELAEATKAAAAQPRTSPAPRP